MASENQSQLTDRDFDGAALTEVRYAHATLNDTSQCTVHESVKELGRASSVEDSKSKKRSEG